MLVQSSVSSGSLYSAAGKRKYLTPAERDRFITAAASCPRSDVQTLCLTLAYTGCRISEALALCVGSIESEEAFIAFRSLKKRGRSAIIREVPVPESLIRALDQAHRLSASDHHRRLWSWSRSRAWQLVKSVMAQAGIPEGIHATPKGLRHGFGLHAIRSGVPLNLVQRWLGHARMETTAIYLQASGPEERELARRMWNSRSGQTGLSSSWTTSGLD